MVSAIISRIVILIFGTLYPAYASYKAVRTKNVREYVKWMMYWIVFALFTCIETFADILVSFWLPFYYEMKILFVLWLLSPATRGSSILYRKFVHPQLNKREKEIDEYIAKAKDQGYTTMIQLGSKGLSYATSVVMQTALKGQETLVQHLRKSYSMNDLVEDHSSSSQQYSTAVSNGHLDETDSGSEDQLHLRWMSEGLLSEEGSDHVSETSSRGRSKGTSPSKTLTRRSRSVRAAKSSNQRTGTSTVKRGSLDEVTTYATLPRATKSKITKKQTKPL